VLAILSFSKELPCSCGGVLQEMSWQQHLVFNIVFTLLALLAAILERKRRRGKLNDTDNAAIHHGHVGS